MWCTNIEKEGHADWMRGGSRILGGGRRAEREVERWCERTVSLGRCEGNRRLRRPVKGEAPKRGRALRALDRPTRRFWDGYKEMG